MYIPLGTRSNTDKTQIPLDPVHCLLEKGGVSVNISHTIHVWRIYLDLVGF